MAKKILIIDDDPDILEIISFVLSEEGYTVLTSTTGEETYRLSEIKPDLILLDMRLSGTNTSGTEICTRLKAEHTTKELPVILVSAEVDIKDLALNCGADDYIPKPFDIHEFAQKIKIFLK